MFNNIAYSLLSSITFVYFCAYKIIITQTVH
nr:MAG TPA: hypothetical protein [Caudoviricetes sp.]